MRNRLLALWCAPRSVSTAFERMMMARGDHTVLHEPFSAHYYLGPERASDRFPDAEPETRHHHAEILARIETQALERPVFLKDMAYHVDRVTDRRFLARFVNSFIIRDPAEALPSLHHIWPDFTDEEAGYASLGRLFDLARETHEADVSLAPLRGDPVVVDAVDLLRDPPATVRAYCQATGLPFLPEAMEWRPSSPPEWKTWDTWHADAKRSSGFDAPAKKRYRAVTEDGRLAEVYAACLPHYRRLRAARLRVP